MTTIGFGNPVAVTDNDVGSIETVAAPPLTVVAKLSDATDTSADFGSATESCAMAISSSEPLLRIDTILFELIAYTDDSLGSVSVISAESVYTTYSGIDCEPAERSGRTDDVLVVAVGETIPSAVSMLQSNEADLITRKFPRTPLFPVSNGASVVRRLSIDAKSISPLPPFHTAGSFAGS